MNLSYYLKIKIEENKLDEIAKEQGLYEDIEDKLLAEFFAIAHHEINRLFMYLMATE